MIPASVYAETLLGFLEPVRAYLDDPTVSEIMINGPSLVFIERRGQLEQTPAKFESREAMAHTRSRPEAASDSAR